ncbi:hypothetical protein RHGRI_010599 [Rhododendron griersonianum]|uniref:Uncharacterized protein n=1 Tax=Rhododendron griersonianum TaxID=479676 RepID=A0AAV6KJ00_9ERIC|nr:hypothetical protein RHGRI_010599 [Rhododendron griersonianum]
MKEEDIIVLFPLVLPTNNCCRVLQLTRKTQTLSLWHHRFEYVLSQPGATFVMGFCLMEQKRHHGMPIMGILGHIKFPEYQLVQLIYFGASRR